MNSHKLSFPIASYLFRSFAVRYPAYGALHIQYVLCSLPN